jgi:hypothetical protein
MEGIKVSELWFGTAIACYKTKDVLDTHLIRESGEAEGRNDSTWSCKGPGMDDDYLKKCGM